MTHWRDEMAAQARLALPVVVVQVGLMAMNVVDVIMVGHLPGNVATQLAAVAVGATIAWLPCAFGMGVLMALDPLVSQAVGARDDLAVARSLQRGVVLTLLLSIPIAIVLLFSESILLALGQQPEVVPVAASYARWSIFGVPAFLLFVTLRQSLQALHRMRPIVIVILLGNVVNLVLDWAFIHGHLGLPALGAVGCSIATSLGRWFMVSALLAAAWSVLAPYLRPLRSEVLSLRPLLNMLALGGPIGVQVFLEMSAFGVVTVAMGQLGETQLAGHQVAINLASLSFMVPLGISAAAAIRVGHAIGRRDKAAVRTAAKVAMLAGAGVMLVSAAIFVSMPAPLARLYSPDPEVVAMAALLLPLAAAFQVFDGLQVVCGGVLRGAGDTRIPLLLYMLGFWIIGIPLCLWMAFERDMGPAGLWWGLVAALAAVSFVLMWRVRWRVANVPERVQIDEVPEVPSGAAPNVLEH
ncbi:MAG: MATE family efflux transporter [Planctomycetota bacterium]|jgi:MATE family multidrug resistance protein